MDANRPDDAGSDWDTRLLWRAGILPAVLLVGPWTCLALILAHLPGSDLADVGWLWMPIVLGSVVSFVVTIFMALRDPHPASTVGALIAIGAAAATGACLAGLYIWLVAADVACHGRYECPL